MHLTTAGTHRCPETRPRLLAGPQSRAGRRQASALCRRMCHRAGNPDASVSPPQGTSRGLSAWTLHTSEAHERQSRESGHLEPQTRPVPTPLPQASPRPPAPRSATAVWGRHGDLTAPPASQVTWPGARGEDWHRHFTRSEARGAPGVVHGQHTRADLRRCFAHCSGNDNI